MLNFFFLAIFVAIAAICGWMLVCAGIGILGALLENSVGGAVICGFAFWAISCLFFDCAWNDLSAAWWGIVLGALIGLYITYQDVKYLF